MPSTKHAKTSSLKPRNSSAKSKPRKEAAKVAAPASPSEPNDSDDDDDEDDDGVDEVGIARLMKALGDDGLDEFGQAQLQSLAGGDDDSSVDEEDGGENDAGSDEESGAEIDEKDGGSEEEDEGGSEDEDEGNDDEEEGRKDGEESEEEEDEDEGVEEDVEIPLDEVESVDEDAVPRQKIEIDDKVSLEQIRESIQLDPSFPWTETLVLSYPEAINVDVNDDLNRELAFYKQALHGANTARALAAKHKFPFTRPSDYFAEMIKSDAHMERIRQRLLDESAGIKKSEDKRKEREGKKFGKQVQIEKLKEREKSKKEMAEKLKGLKRKRGDVLDNRQDGEDDFDIAVEDAISDRPAKRGKSDGKGVPRSVRDKKYGFGGATRRSKQNTRESTDNFDSGSGRGRGRGRGGFRGGGRGGKSTGRGGKGSSSGSRGRGSKRLGKSRRDTARSKT